MMARFQLVIVLLCAISLVSSNPISDWTERLSTEESDAFHDKLKEELETEAIRQVALATRLEEAAALTARKARELQEQAETAKLHALEAVEQEKAVLERELSSRATSRSQGLMSGNIMDPLMDKGRPLIRKRGQDLEPLLKPQLLDDPDMLEALRVLYLQELLTNRGRQAELRSPSERVVFVPSDDIWSERKPEADDEALARVRELLASNNLYDSTDHGLLPERLLTSPLEGNY